MTRDDLLLLPLGTILVTPFEPVARFRMTSIELQTVFGFFLHDHRGYSKNSAARYFINEVKTVEEAEAGCRDGDGHVSHDVIGERCVRCGKEIS